MHPGTPAWGTAQTEGLLSPRGRGRGSRGGQREAQQSEPEAAALWGSCSDSRRPSSPPRQDSRSRAQATRVECGSGAQPHGLFLGGARRCAQAPPAGRSPAVTRLCPQGAKPAPDRPERNERGCSNKTLPVSPGISISSNFHMSQNSILLLTFLKHLKNVKTTLGSQAIRKRRASSGPRVMVCQRLVQEKAT